MNIFDMGKNLKMEGKLFDVGIPNKNGDSIDPKTEFSFTGKFPKKKGRPKMDEKFFYDPYEGDKSVFADVSGAFIGIDVGSVITSSFGKVQAIDDNTLKIIWKIIYGTV